MQSKARTRDARRDAPRRIRDRLWALGRLAFFVGVLCVATGAVAARSAYGDVRRSALALGHELGKLDDGPGRALRLNGQTLFVGAETAAVPVSALLDRVEAACRANAAAVFGEIEALKGRASERRGAADGASAAAPGAIDALGAAAGRPLRSDDDGRGYVACFTGAGESAAGDLARRLERFAASGDLGAIGAFRYVYAERIDAEHTRILSAWTEASFNILALVPGEGDCPGTDPVAVPRPPEATRLLSAQTDGAPYGIFVYRSTRGAAEVIADYEHAMTARGAEALAPAAGAGAATRVFRTGSVDAIVVTEVRGEGSTVTVVESLAR
jgi:hypothetical protein